MGLEQQRAIPSHSASELGFGRNRQNPLSVHHDILVTDPSLKGDIVRLELINSRWDVCIEGLSQLHGGHDRRERLSCVGDGVQSAVSRSEVSSSSISCARNGVITRRIECTQSEGVARRLSLSYPR